MTEPNETQQTDETVSATTEEQATTESTETTASKPVEAKPNYDMTRDVIVVAKSASFLPLSSFGALISQINQDNLNAVIENIKLSKISDNDNQWMTATVDAMNAAVNPVFKYAAAPSQDPDAVWKQSIKRGDVSIGYQTHNPTGKSGAISGMPAVYAVAGALSAGLVINVPLVTSGFWVTLRAPSDAAMVLLHQQILSMKSALGRSTNGMIFSYSAAYMTGHLMEMIKEHIVGTSLRGVEISQIDNHITALDFYLLVHALASAKYPYGYRHQMPCIADPATCRHITEGNISIARLIWFDDRKFTDAMVTALHLNRQSVTVEGVTAYRELAFSRYKKSVEVGNNLNVKVNVKIPMIGEFITDAYRWIAGCEKTVEKAFSGQSEAQRNRQIELMAASATLTKFASSIESFEITDPISDTVAIVSSHEDIVNTCSMISAENDVMEAIIDFINDYVTDCMPFMFGIPNYKCTACKKDQVPDVPNETVLIPFDVVRVFFTLMEHKLAILGQLSGDM